MAHSYVERMAVLQTTKQSSKLVCVNSIKPHANCKQTDQGLRMNWYHIPGIKEWQKEWEKKRAQSHILIHFGYWNHKGEYRDMSRVPVRTREQLWGQCGHTGTIQMFPVVKRECTKVKPQKKKKKKRDQERTKKEQKARHTRKRRSETGGKRPRPHQTIPLSRPSLGRVTDEFSWGTDRFFFFFFSPFLMSEDIWDWIIIWRIFVSFFKENTRQKSKKNKSPLSTQVPSGTAGWTNEKVTKSDRAQMRFWPRILVSFGFSLPCRFNYHRLSVKMVLYIGKGHWLPA